MDGTDLATARRQADGQHARERAAHPPVDDGRVYASIGNWHELVFGNGE
jgi:hypothetical protein